MFIHRQELLVPLFIASLLDAPRQRDSVKNKPASLLDVLCRWERHLTGLSSRSGGEVADNS